jgi:hypothetical protein
VRLFHVKFRSHRKAYSRIWKVEGACS